MSVFSIRLALAVGLAALGLGGPTAHAQGASQGTSVPYYWASGWSSGFGGNLSADQGANANTTGDSAGFANNTAGPGAFMQRYNFSSSSFLGNERGGALGNEIQVRDELLIGRHASEQGRLGDDIEISRRHARISRTSSATYLSARGRRSSEPTIK